MNLPSPDILFEDNHLIVCVKPAGIATQTKKIGTPDMVSILKNHLAKGRKTPGQAGSFPLTPAYAEPYLAVIHRLDQPVQGIMVFARTPFAAKELCRELQMEGFGKHYRAAVSTKPPKDSGILEDYMVRDGRTNTSRICEKKTAGAKLARLSYSAVDESERFFTISPPAVELDVQLFTGRHHQIRAQLSNIGCPIIGDVKYTAGQTQKCSRQELKLCSYRLEFTHPKTKKRLAFELETRKD